jgi:hypothetical protein
MPPPEDEAEPKTYFVKHTKVLGGGGHRVGDSVGSRSAVPRCWARHTYPCRPCVLLLQIEARRWLWVTANGSSRVAESVRHRPTPHAVWKLRSPHGTEKTRCRQREVPRPRPSRKRGYGGRMWSFRSLMCLATVKVEARGRCRASSSTREWETQSSRRRRRRPYTARG